MIAAMQIAMTGEGINSLANSLVTNIAPTVGYFRLAKGDYIPEGSMTDKTDYYDALKTDHTVIPACSQFMNFTADDFKTVHPVGGTSLIDLDSIGISTDDGFIAVNSIELGTTSNNGYFFDVEINCYIPPAVGSGFIGANEIMVYTGTPTTPRSFMWGIFPEITKLDEYGLNFKVILQF